MPDLIALFTGSMNTRCHQVGLDRIGARPSAARGLGVCGWSPEGLHDKSVSLIPNTDEILKIYEEKN